LLDATGTHGDAVAAEAFVGAIAAALPSAAANNAPPHAQRRLLLLQELLHAAYVALRSTMQQNKEAGRSPGVPDRLLAAITGILESEAALSPAVLHRAMECTQVLTIGALLSAAMLG
jgi:hypothetical protein